MPGSSFRSTVAPNGKRIIAIGRAVGKRPSSDVLAEGAHRRFFWRVNHRFGSDWWRMTDAQIRKEMRMLSNRRSH